MERYCYFPQCLSIINVKLEIKPLWWSPAAAQQSPEQHPPPHNVLIRPVTSLQTK